MNRSLPMPSRLLPRLLPRLLQLLLGALACVLAGGSLTGCFDTDDRDDTRVAGGDDYPNGVDPLGKKSAGAMSDSADWNGFDTLPTTAPGLYDTVDVPEGAPDTAKPAPAPKRGGSAPAMKRAASADKPLAGPDLLPLDTVVTRVLDSAKGTVETVRTQVTDSGVKKVDSVVTAPVDPALPGSPVAVTQAARTVVSADSGRAESWVFTDGDGDGFLASKAGSASVVRIERTAALASGRVEKSVQRLASGADLDYGGRGDNRLLASALVVLQGGDTVSVTTLLDADGDGSLIDFLKDTNLVDVVEEARFAAGPVASVTRTLRLVAVSKDSSRNHPVRYSERRVLRTGAVLEIAARGLTADSSFRPGSEATWSETRFGAPGDSASRAARAFRVRLAAAAGDFAKNVLLGFAVEEAYRAGGGGPEAFVLDFRAEEPVASGRWVSSGDVVAWVVLPGGKRVSFAGVSTVAGLRGQVTGPDGKSAAIAFDAQGGIVARP